jgi:hypothetical protein
MKTLTPLTMLFLLFHNTVYCASEVNDNQCLFLRVANETCLKLQYKCVNKYFGYIIDTVPQIDTVLQINNSTKVIDSLALRLKLQEAYLSKLLNEINIQQKLINENKRDRVLGISRISGIFGKIKKREWTSEEYMLAKEFADELEKFPIPPYKATSSMRIPDSSLSYITKQNQLDSILKRKLAIAGFYEYYYYPLPEDYPGFAIALNLEEFDKESGLPKRLVKTEKKSLFWDIIDYFERLVTEEKGYYRTIVFIVTNKPFSNNGPDIRYVSAKSLSAKGASQLPVYAERKRNNKKTSVDNPFHCYCYIYEFVKTENDNDPYCAETGVLAPVQHLKSLNIFNL